MKKPTFFAGVAVLLLLAVLLALGGWQVMEQRGLLDDLRGKVSDITAPIGDIIAPPSASIDELPTIQPPASYNPLQPPTITETPAPTVYPGGGDLDDYGDYLPQYQSPESTALPTYIEQSATVPKDGDGA